MDTLLNIYIIVTSVISIASVIVAATKTESDDLVLATIKSVVMPVLDIISMSTVGHAKKK